MKNEVIYQRKQVSKKVPLLKCMKKGEEEQRAKTRQHGYLLYQDIEEETKGDTDKEQGRSR